MIAVTVAVQAIVATICFGLVGCEEVFGEKDLLRLHQLSSGDGQVEAITSYSTNIIQRNPVRNEHSISSVNVQYHLAEDVDKSNDYHRIANGRSDKRKVFRIKNPFQQRQLDSSEHQQEDSSGLQDGDTQASNQYAAMQYSLPPEEFLQKIRAENQYLQQYSTPAPSLSYTATPQPQYYKNSATNFDQGSNSQLDAKSLQSQSFPSNQGSYQYIGSSYDTAQNTPSPVPPYVSTMSNNQYVATPSNNYVSSSAPAYLSSQSSVQQYLSSPLSVAQTGTADYDSRITTAGSNPAYSVSYDSGELNKRMQIDHYDNSANGIRYPIQSMQQFSNEYPTSTPSPSSTPFPDLPENWQNNYNNGVNTLSKSLQEVSLSQYRPAQLSNNVQMPQDGRGDYSQEYLGSETHRVGNMPAANNLYLNFVHPDYQMYNNLRSRTRDVEHDVSQPGGNVYSNGDYGWKLNEKKPSENEDSYQSGSYSRYNNYAARPEVSSYNNMNLFYDPSRQHSYEPISKSATESQDAQEFAKAAARAHEQMKQQQQMDKLNNPYYGHSYTSSYNLNNPIVTGPNVVTTFYGNTEKYKNRLLADSSNNNHMIYNNNQQDLITALPYYVMNQKDSYDNKIKQPFDHAKALKNIVPIDVSNVIGNSEQNSKATGTSENNGNRYNVPSYSKDSYEQNFKQYYKPIADTYYKDKNTGYGYNIKAKPEENPSTDDLKSYEQSVYYNKPSHQESSFNQGVSSENKRYGESGHPGHYLTQSSNSYPNNIQQITNSQRPQNPSQNDLANFLKLNDIPYRLTQGIPSESLRLHNENFDQSPLSGSISGKINQNVGSHQIDVANSILSKLMQKQPGVINLRPDLDLQSSGLLSTINGFRVANPFNVDLKLVAEMLKGKSPGDESHLSFRDQYPKPSPQKLDLPSLQQLLLKNDNYGNLIALSDGLSGLGSPYMEIYNNNRYPYNGGVKYSRSQEEEESILPIAESSNTHPIGAVIEQEDLPDAREVSEGSELTSQSDDPANTPVTENKYKHIRDHHRIKPMPRHPNALLANRHLFRRKFPKNDGLEPYPLLKPPPQEHGKGRHSHSAKVDKRGRRRRTNSRPIKYSRMLNAEPLFEAESSLVEESESTVPTLLQPPPAPDANSDATDKQNS